METYNLATFCLIWYFTSQSTIFSYVGRVFLGWTSTKQGLMCFTQGHNTVMPVRLKPATPRSWVKHFTTEPLRSQLGHFTTWLTGSPKGVYHINMYYINLSCSTSIYIQTLSCHSMPLYCCDPEKQSQGHLNSINSPLYANSVHVSR